jgi:uncharacterized Zn-finger protein
MRNCHSGNDQSHICHICSKEYKNKSGMEYHLKTAHVETRDYKCQVPDCGKRFRLPSALHYHRRLVHGPKPFSCHMCPFKTAKKTNLNSHINFVHENPELRLHTCECGKSFKQLKHLRHHKESVHNNGQYSCMFCSAVLKMKSTLLKHHKKLHPVEFAEYKRREKAAALAMP